MYFDGSLKLEGGGTGVLLIIPQGEHLKYILQTQFPVSNNKAEYEALLHGLRLVVSLSIKHLLLYGDSMVVIKQINKDWNRTKENIDAYRTEVCKLEKNFLGLEFHYVERGHNVASDVLSKLDSSRAEVPCDVFVNELSKPSITEHASSNNSVTGLEVMLIDIPWTQPFWIISCIRTTTREARS